MRWGYLVRNVTEAADPPKGKSAEMRLHELRHNHASAALAAGVPAKVISERLGHVARLILGEGGVFSGLRIRCSHGCAGAWRAPAPLRQLGRGWPSG